MKGRGGITRRKDGRYQGTYVGSDGVKRYVLHVERKVVEAALDEATRLRDAGVFVAGPSQSTGQFLTTWLAATSPDLRPRTAERYESLLRVHVIPALGEIPLRKLQAQQLAELYGRLRDTLAPATIATLHAILHSAFGLAVEWNAIARNPTDAVRPPRVERREMQVLSVPEIGQLFTAARGDPLEALYVLAVTSGLRQGELLALRWRDVDLERAVLEVNGTLTRVGAGWSRTRPKTPGSYRTVPLSERAVAALRSHRIRMAEQLLPLRQRTEGDVFVFLSPLGEPYNGFRITERHFKPLLRRAGLREIRFHDLRHAFASLMLSQGTRPDLVSRMLGHSSPAITMSVYAHLLPGDEAAAMKRLDAALGGAG